MTQTLLGQTPPIEVFNYSSILSPKRWEAKPRECVCYKTFVGSTPKES